MKEGSQEHPGGHTHIYVGDNTMFGPNVTVTTAGHPNSQAAVPDTTLRLGGFYFTSPA